MDEGEHHQELVDTLAVLAAERELTALVIGAHALAELGVARQTLDLDLMIVETDQAVFAELLRGLGFVPVAETTSFQRFAHAKADVAHVDVLFVDAPTFGQLIASSSSFDEGGAFRIPSIQHFVALKLHAIRNNPKREARDLGDVAELLRANPSAVEMTAIEEICRSHGPEGIYSSLEKLL